MSNTKADGIDHLVGAAAGSPPAPVGSPAPAAGDGQGGATAEKKQKRALAAYQRADIAVRASINVMATTTPRTTARDEARRALDAAVAKREDARRQLVNATDAKIIARQVKP